MTQSNKEIHLLTEKFMTYTSGGTSSLRKYPTAARTVVTNGEGSRVWGADGTEFLDYACAYGPNILGHRHPEYTESLKQMLDSTTILVGGDFGFSEKSVIAAEKIIQHVPCAERVRFIGSGTDAVQTAMRVARAHTGRPYVLTFEGHYHGWMDNTLGIKVVSEPKGIPRVEAVKECLGRAPGAEDGMLGIVWNDIEIFEATLRNYGDQIALVIMEPFKNMLPRPGYLERVRELCTQYGVVLCFDEVLTGFRPGISCAQGAFGVTPDLTTLAKALGGGIPISAVAGKAEVMDVLLKEETTKIGGTHAGNFLGVQAAISTLEILARDNGAVYIEMERVQKKLMAGLDEIARRRGIPLRVQGITGWFSTLFGIDPDTVWYSKYEGANIDTDMLAKFWQLMHQQGVMSGMERWLLSIMHTDQDTEIALEAADRAMSKL